jgi:Lon protease-like protein
MYELPLFPLNTVLFPGMPLRLHIFEERYKLMIGKCYQSEQPFGVTLIESGQEVGGSAEPYRVGCTALITEVEPLSMGRMNIIAIGQERFEVQSFRYDQPYLTGMVESYIMRNDNPSQLVRAGRNLRPLVREYLQVLADASESKVELSDLPGDPLRLANLASYLLQVSARQKQDLLATRDSIKLVNDLRGHYRREVALLKAMVTAREQTGLEVGPFSLN